MDCTWNLSKYIGIRSVGCFWTPWDTGKIANLSFTDYICNVKFGMYQDDVYTYKFRNEILFLSQQLIKSFEGL